MRLNTKHEVISAYAPTRKAGPDFKDSCYLQIKELFQEPSAHERLVFLLVKIAHRSKI